MNLAYQSISVRAIVITPSAAEHYMPCCIVYFQPRPPRTVFRWNNGCLINRLCQNSTQLSGTHRRKAYRLLPDSLLDGSLCFDTFPQRQNCTGRLVEVASRAVGSSDEKETMSARYRVPLEVTAFVNDFVRRQIPSKFEFMGYGMQVDVEEAM